MRKLDDDRDVEVGNRRPTAMDPHILLSATERRRLGSDSEVVVDVPAPVGAIAA